MKKYEVVNNLLHFFLILFTNAPDLTKKIEHLAPMIHTLLCNGLQVGKEPIEYEKTNQLTV